MKQLFLFCIAVILISQANAQNVGIGTTTPTQTLDVNGWVKLGDQNAPVPPNTHTEGSIRYNRTTKTVEYNSGGTSANWTALATQASAVPQGAIIMWSGSFANI